MITKLAASLQRIKLGSGHTVAKASTKLVFIGAIGLVAGLIAGFTAGWNIAPLVGWDVIALTFVTSTWYRVRHFTPDLVKQHALREDPSRVTSDLVLIGASVASVGAVGVLLAAPSQASGADSLAFALLGVFSVVASWFMVHTIYTLKYAELYYIKPQGGVDFGHDKDPAYADFAYLAFTIGMTYQVSDTSLQTRQFRSIALRHALLSFLMGTVIIATTINLIANLGQ
jgi:uncharacterized membrane protein